MRAVKNILLSIPLLLLMSPASEAKQPSREERLSEHLSLLDVTSFAQDGSGHIWIGTLGGLDKYNGYEYEHFSNKPGDPESLSSDFVFSLLYDEEKDELWVGTISGLCRYNPENEGFTPCVGDYSVYSIFRDAEDILWLATPVGALRYDPITGETSLQCQETKINLFWEDDHGRLWAGTGSGELAARTNGTVWERIPVPQKREVTGIFRTPNRIWWLGTDEGLLFFDPSSRSFPEDGDLRALRQAIGHTRINFLCEAEPMKILIGTATEGVFLYDLISQKLEHNSPSYYNPNRSSQAQCCFLDKSGMVWIGTYDKGFFTAKKQSDYFCTDQVLNEAVRNKFCTRVVPGQDGAMWISTRYDGIFRYESDGRLTHFSSSDLLSEPSGNHPDAGDKDFLEAILIDSKGKLWAAFESCLVMGHVAGNRLVPEKKTPLKNVRAIKEDRDGHIWCGTWNGFFEAGKSGALSERPVCRIPGNVPEFIFLDDGKILVSVYADNIYEYDPAAGNPSPAMLPDTYRDIARNCISLFRDRQGNLWLGSYYHGLACVGADGSIRRLTAGDGLPSNNVLCLQEDNEGYMWASTHCGIVRIIHGNAGLRVTSYNLRGILPGEQYHEKSGGISPGGAVFFGGNHGVTYFQPSDIPENTRAPLINIEDIKVFNRSLSPEDGTGLLVKDIGHTGEITLSYRQRTITIDYAGIDYFSSNNLSYRYRLEGFDPETVSVGPHRRVSYSNLPPGKYTFRVWAIGEDGIPCESPAVLRFRIKRSPWLSAPALLLYLVLLALFLLTLVKSILGARRNRVREEEKRREKEKELAEIINRNMTALGEKDKRFLQQLDEVVRRELANPDFSVDALAMEMGFSRTALFNKIKGLAGMSPKDFIRNYRFKTAAALIREGDLSLTEIADRTGFNSYSYFSKAFKQHFGISPKDLRPKEDADEKRAGPNEPALEKTAGNP